MRALAILLGLIFLILQGQLWLGQGSLPDLWKLQQRVAEQQQRNQQLRERNAALAAEVEDLKTALQAVEERARSEIGMIREGETFYQVADPALQESEEDTDE
ncbi:MAG: cell division protein FtsB [Gammaproteobacteria bacterium]|nr:cell division protein FtsB [Gammaproteobacteria bacterium]